MTGGHSGSGLGDAIKKGVGMVHAIRGNFNASIDQASGDRAGVDKNIAIASSGADEIEHGYHRTGHGAGVTPADADHERLNTNHTTSTNYGPHSTNTANKLDPRFDSDADHRANPNKCCTSTSVSQMDGADSGNDHDHDEHSVCHAQHIHRGSISGGANLEPAQKLDPILGTDESSMKANSHCTNIADKQDSGVESETDCPSTKQGPTNYDSHSTNSGNRPILHIDPDLDRRSDDATAQVRRSGTFPRRGTEPSMKTSHACEAIRTGHEPESDDELDRHARRISLAKDALVPLDESQLSTSPYNGGFLVLLDPRVDRNGAKQMRSSGS